MICIFAVPSLRSSQKDADVGIAPVTRTIRQPDMPLAPSRRSRSDGLFDVGFSVVTDLQASRKL
jgi:hypothetical protein